MPGSPVCRTFTDKSGQKRIIIAHTKAVVFTPVWLCPSFFDDPPYEQAATLVHEAAHGAFSALDRGPAGAVSDELRGDLNADSYAEFARDAFMGGCSPTEVSQE